MTAPIGRVLVAPLNASHRQRGQVEAFQEVFGASSVLEFDWMAEHNRGRDAGAALVACAAKFRPDWIWLQLQGADGITPWRIGQLRAAHPRCLVTHWMGDCRAEVPELLAQTCRATHATLLSNRGQLDLYRRAGAPRAHYVQIGLDPEDLPTAPDQPPPFAVPDVVFCGGFYGHVSQFGRGTELRLAVIRALLRAKISVGVVGRGWPTDIPIAGECHVKQQAAIYRRAKVCLSINHFNDLSLYYSDRHLIALASGTPVVAYHVPDLETEFTPGVDCLMWKTLDELVHQVRLLIASPAAGRAIGRHGQARVLAEHTWSHRITTLRPIVQAWRGALP